MRTLAIIATLSVALLSCEIEDPEPIVGSAGRGLTIHPVVMDGYSWAQPVTGTITVRLPSALITSDVTGFAIGFDTSIVTPILNPGVAVSLNLTNVPAGEHQILFFVFTVQPFEGMLGVVGAPRRSYYTAVTVVPNTPPPSPPPPLPPPAAPTGVVVAWNDHPRVTWDATSDTNFVSYIVRRHDMIDGRITTIGTILDRLVTTLDDTQQPDLIGTGVAYSVGLSNRNQTTFCGPVETSHGTPFPLSSVDAFLQRPGMPEAFVLSEGRTRLSVVSTASHTVLRSVVTDAWPGVLGDWGVSADGSTVYLFTNSLQGAAFDTVLTMYAYAAATLAKLGQWRIPTGIDQEPRLGVGLGSRLYVVDAFPRLMVMDGATGAVLDSSSWVPVYRARILGVSGDRNSLYVVGADGVGASFTLFRYDISGVTPVQAVALPTGAWISHAIPTPSGSQLVLLRDFLTLDVVDPTTLSRILLIPNPDIFNGYSETTRFVVTDSHIIIGYRRNTTEHLIARFSLWNGQMTRWWLSARSAAALFSADAGGMLYAAGAASDATQSWMVSLVAP